MKTRLAVRNFSCGRKLLLQKGLAHGRFDRYVHTTYWRKGELSKLQALNLAVHVPTTSREKHTSFWSKWPERKKHFGSIGVELVELVKKNMAGEVRVYS